jgi:anti-anti-sigma regulatory factor
LSEGLKVPKLEIRERQVGAVTVLELREGLVSSADGDALDQKLQTLILEGSRALLLECKQVSAFNSFGIKPLVRAHVSMLNREGALKLLRVSLPMRETLASVNLMSALESFDDERKAVRSFNS